VLGRPAEAGPPRGRQMPVPGHPLGMRLVLAPGAARIPQRGKTAGEIGGEPFADTTAELLVLRAGAQPVPPCDGPAGPQGGLQARGSSVAGQRLPAARRLSLPSTCFVRGHLVELTIPAMIASAAGKYGDGPALAEPGGPRISYHQLLQQTTTVARALIAEGVAHRDRVAIGSPNTHHWILAAFGALSGCTLVPVSTRFTGPGALDVITRSGASVLIVADRFLGTDRFAALRTAAVTEAAHAGAGADKDPGAGSGCSRQRRRRTARRR
jgi:non-ribosomal peptide synthetase component F